MKGDLIYLDMGAMKFGYQCDMSRSVVVGGANEEQKHVLDVILNAYQHSNRRDDAWSESFRARFPTLMSWKNSRACEKGTPEESI